MKREAVDRDQGLLPLEKRQRLQHIASLHRVKLHVPGLDTNDTGVSQPKPASFENGRKVALATLSGCTIEGSTCSSTAIWTPNAPENISGSRVAFMPVPVPLVVDDTPIPVSHEGHGLGSTHQHDSDDDSDSLGSAVIGEPSCNPLHVLSAKCAKGISTKACGSLEATSGVMSVKVGSPSGITSAGTTFAPQARGPTAEVPSLGISNQARAAEHPSWLCRRDLSAAATQMQAAMANAEQSLEEELAESKESSKKARKGKRNACFPYGNYNRYYGYRLGDSFDEDPRLRVLEPAWFAGKKVLDIGCNEGILTLALTCKFCCKSTVGVDIDKQLVCKASRSLAKLRSQLTSNLTQRCTSFPGHKQMKDLRGSIRALKHTRFEHLDFVNGTSRVARAETVLCLSVTKWVHFNWGDDGVRKLFKRVYHVLHPGGLFVLEPQPWRSYKQVFKKQETLSALPYKNLDSFTLRPENFAEYLCKTHRFQLVQELQIGTAAKGFDRPLLIFQKQ